MRAPNTKEPPHVDGGNDRPAPRQVAVGRPLFQDARACRRCHRRRQDSMARPASQAGARSARRRHARHRGGRTAVERDCALPQRPAPPGAGSAPALRRNRGKPDAAGIRPRTAQARAHAGRRSQGPPDQARRQADTGIGVSQGGKTIFKIWVLTPAGVICEND